MPRRPRLLVLLLPTLLLMGLTSCGQDDPSPLDAVTIKGAAGTEPEVTFKSRMVVTEVGTEVLEKGDGPVIKEGDQVSIHLWIGNGYTKKQSLSTWEQGRPETVTVDANLPPIFASAIKGQTIGSRVAVTATGEEAFGEAGNPSLQIGNQDSVLVLLDLISVSTVLDGPEGESLDAPDWAPGLIETDGTITGFDFTIGQAPDGTLRSATLIAGTGATVESGQTITVNYLGQVYDAKKPFDDSYSRGAPATFTIGVGQVIKGWDKELIGQNVGSRVIIAIPPDAGYGSKGNPDAGIGGTDTIYFVVDILGVA